MDALEKRQNFTLLRLFFIQKSRNISDRIAAHIDSTADDMLWKIKHDLEWFNDPKAFYEKEIPFLIENQVRKDMKLIPEFMTQQYTANLYWLHGQLKHMGVQAFNLPFSDYDINSPDHIQDKLNLIDIQKTRLCSRLGTLFVALCLSGFGLGAFVGSMLCGTAAEEFLLSRSKVSKEKIRQVVPAIIDNYKLQMKTRMLGVVAEVDSNIINGLNNIQI